ncbi:MAG: CoA transferase [Chloroflexi bacterium]|nr:CoA transferase [Chloroflexota bacterium]MDA1002231.1 CoA transferase [Chloroflexota bacterium]
MADGPLSGVRVLEFSQIVAASYTGVNLSDLGADVVKVEPLTGEAYRDSGAVVPGEGKRFQSLNRGKRSVAIDLHDARGQALVHRIVPGFDVVTINYRPGVAERLRIDDRTLRALHPDLIYCRITGFGPEGPLASHGATDLVAGAYTGLVAGNGKVDEDGAPAMLTPAVADYTTGLAAAMAICAALYHRRAGGRGQLIEGSLLQSALSIQDVYVMREPVTDASHRDPLMAELTQMRAAGASYTEQLELRANYRRVGSGIPRLYYSGYLAQDGALVLGCLTRPTRAAARRVLGMERDLTDSPEFDSTDPQYQRLVSEWKAEIQATIRTRTVADWVARFEAVGVPVAPAHFPEELADDPQVEAMGIMVDLEHAVTGPQRVVGPVVRMSETPATARAASPALAAHTDEVLREHSLSPDEIATLRADGVIR